MSLWQSDPFSWLTEDEALLEMGLMVMLLVLVLLVRGLMVMLIVLVLVLVLVLLMGGLMVMLLVLEPAEREASVELLSVPGNVEDLIHHLLNL